LDAFERILEFGCGNTRDHFAYDESEHSHRILGLEFGLMQVWMPRAAEPKAAGWGAIVPRCTILSAGVKMAVERIISGNAKMRTSKEGLKTGIEYSTSICLVR
jgi:hypothetical protein